MSRLARRLLMVTTPPFIGLLDRLDAIAAGAWSLRRLRGGYGGPSINVRRDSDDATRDIGFTFAGDLNVAAMLAFVGSANGYIAKWYDQTPGASHLAQPASAQQPQIVASGALLPFPTWPAHGAIMTNGGAKGVGGSFIQSATPAPALSLAQPLSRSSVLAFPSGLSPSNGNPVVLDSGETAGVELYQSSQYALDTYADDLAGDSGGGFTSIAGVSTGSIGALLELFDGANSNATFNDVITSGSVGPAVSRTLSVGSDANHARCSHSQYGEIIEFPQCLAISDQQVLAIDQCRYWQTPSPYRGVVLKDSPYAYWPLDETSGTVAADVSGNGLNGVYQPGALLAAGALMQGKGNYVGLTGASNSYVDVSAASQFFTGPTWSAECWASVAAFTVAGADSSHGTIWGRCDGSRFLGNTTWRGGSGVGSGLEWGIEAWNANSPWYGDIIFVQGGPGTVRANQNTAPAPGTLNHHVVTYSAGIYSLYQNGVLLITGSTASATAQSGLQIGTPGWTCGAFDGVIGEVALYRSALTAEQIARHYAAGVALRAAPSFPGTA